jgi:tripartite-type tricarboxylate transporter receptor subunit TctC
MRVRAAAGTAQCLVGVVMAVFAAAAFVPQAARAQDPAAFYAGRSVELDIGYSVGGGYDLYGRLLARHLGRHIPGNPTIVPKNMEGAGSLRLANYLYMAAPRDGTVIGTVARGIAFDPLLNESGAQYDATKLSWLGSANNEVAVCVALKSAGVTSFDQLYSRSLTIGSTGIADDTYQFPAVVNAVLGTKFKIVTGYPGGNDVSLAIERGEVDGRCGWSWSSLITTRPAWLAEKKISVLVQMSLAKHPDLQDVPLIMDMAKTDEEREIFKLIFSRQIMGRPFLAPPLPPERLAVLRKAFDDTMTDKQFLADAAQNNIEINPVPGTQIQAMIKEGYDTPPDVVKKAGVALR